MAVRSTVFRFRSFSFMSYNILYTRNYDYTFQKKKKGMYNNIRKTLLCMYTVVVAYSPGVVWALRHPLYYVYIMYTYTRNLYLYRKSSR